METLRFVDLQKVYTFIVILWMDINLQIPPGGAKSRYAGSSIPQMQESIHPQCARTPSQLQQTPLLKGPQR